MSGDILVGKLRGFATTGRERRSSVTLNRYHADVLDEAATTIEALRARLGEAERVIAPFAAKAAKWDANHPVHEGGFGRRDSTQIEHRLGDFRAASRFLSSIGGDT